MVFRIISAEPESNKMIVKGLLVPANEDERELLLSMVDELSKLELYSGKCFSNKHTIIFRDVEGDLLKNMLGYLSQELEIPLEYALSKNFHGDHDYIAKNFL